MIVWDWRLEKINAAFSYKCIFNWFLAKLTDKLLTGYILFITLSSEMPFETFERYVWMGLVTRTWRAEMRALTECKDDLH